MIEMKPNPDSPVKCRVKKDFVLSGLKYRTGQIYVLSLNTAKLLSLAGKIRLLQEAPEALHGR